MRARRIDSMAAARMSSGWSASARLAGPIADGLEDRVFERSSGCKVHLNVQRGERRRREAGRRQDRG